MIRLGGGEGKDGGGCVAGPLGWGDDNASTSLSTDLVCLSIDCDCTAIILLSSSIFLSSGSSGNGCEIATGATPTMHVPTPTAMVFTYFSMFESSRAGIIWYIWESCPLRSLSSNPIAPSIYP